MPEIFSAYKEKFPEIWDELCRYFGIDSLLDKLRSAFNQAENQISPIILDLDGDGVVETRSLASDGLQFDLDNTGYAERTGWVGSDDGLLVRDLNGNGRIDSGAELFGNHTRLSDGSLAANGFAALAELDTNGDGIVNADDGAAFASLRVWKDGNGNGQTDEGELLTLEQAGVAALHLNHANHGSGVGTADAQGNEHRQRGTYTAADGSTRGMNDVWFAVDAGHAVDLNTMAVVSAEIAALPDLPGMGNTPSLHQAMARDSSGALQALVTQWVAASEEQRPALLTQIIYRWTGVQDVGPASRGDELQDARHLEALERVMGQAFRQNGLHADPATRAAGVLEQAFFMLERYVQSQLLWQTDWRPLLDSIGLTWNGQTSAFELDVSPLVDGLRARYEANPEQGLRTIGLLSQHLALGEGAFATQVLAAVQRAGEAFDGDFGIWLQYGDRDIVQQGTGANDTLEVTQRPWLGAALLGHAGADTLVGGWGDDVLVGGAGNDWLEGGEGNDTYVFKLGDGADVIEDFDTHEGNHDTLRLGPGLTAAATQVIRRGEDLLLQWEGNPTDRVTIRNFFYSSNPTRLTNAVESVEFAEGSRWGLPELLSKVVYEGTASGEILYGGNGTTHRIHGLGGHDELVGGDLDDLLDGGDGNDTLRGGSGADTLIGGRGNDTLYGGEGDDTYVFNLGDGRDTLYDNDSTSGNHDTLRLGAGLSVSDTEVLRNGDDLVLRWAGNEGDSVTVRDVFYSSQVEHRNLIESVVFHDGSVWDMDDLMGRLVQQGTVGGDWLSGLHDRANRMQGLGGNDELAGGSLDDLLDGGDGDDTLYGGEGADTLIGGKGRDVLEGGMGNDTYVFNLGDGHDTLIDNDSTSGNHDTLRLSAGLSAADTEVLRYGDDLVLRWTGNSTDSITIQGAFDYGQVDQRNLIESVVFADGTAWSAQQLLAQLGQPNQAPEAVQALSAPAATQGALLSYTVPQDAFLDPDEGDTLSYSARQASGAALPVWLSFNAATRTLSGTPPEGAVGTWSIRITATDTAGEQASSVLSLQINPTQDSSSTTVQSATSHTLAAGMANLVLTGNQAINGIGNVLDNRITGNDKNNVLNGNAGNDTLIGGKGNDTLYGGSGNDTYIFNFGDGKDVITDLDYSSGNHDTLRLGEGLTQADTEVVRNGNDLLLRWAGDSTDSVTIQGVFSGSQLSNANLVESVLFADGQTWGVDELMTRLIQDGTASANTLTGLSSYANRLNGLAGNDTLHGGNLDDVLDGGEGNDTLQGNAGNDTLIGGKGNDTLNGGSGNDTYIFNFGDGKDVITDLDYSSGNHDTLRLGAGLTQADTEVVRNGNDLLLRWAGNGTDSVTIQGVFSGAQLSNANLVESVLFADGQTWGVDDLMARLIQDGTASANTLTGLSGYANRLNGLGGNDTLYGGNLDDVLEGGEGNDTLYGNAGHDTLVGGKGNDMLNGGSGNDTYVFNQGDGADVITDQDYSSGNHDTLRLGEGLTQASTEVVRNGNDLLLRWTGAGTDSVTIQGVFSGAQISNANLIESVAFADGQTWGVDELMARLIQNGTAGNNTLTGLSSYANRLNGLAGNDTLYGGNLDDVLEGGDGNDTLYGNAGHDTLSGGKGNDTLNGGSGNDTYVFNRGDGKDTLIDNDYASGNRDVLRLGEDIRPDQLWFRRSGYDLDISLIGTNEGVLVRDWYRGANNQVETIRTSDLQALINNQVDQLVQAMAAFAPPAPGQTSLPPDYQSVLAPVIAASWQ